MFETKWEERGRVLEARVLDGGVGGGGHVTLPLFNAKIFTPTSYHHLLPHFLHPRPTPTSSNPLP